MLLYGQYPWDPVLPAQPHRPLGGKLSSNWILPILDNVTVSFTTLTTTLVVTVWLLVAIRINRSVPGLPTFAWGLAASWLGSFLSVARIVFPSPFIVLAANVLFVGGLIWSANGVRAFRGRNQLARRVVWLVLSILAVPYLYYLFVQPLYYVRVAIVSPLIAFMSIDEAMSMVWKVPRRDRLVYWQAAASFGFTAAVLVLRSCAALLGGYGPEAFLPGATENVITILSASAWIGQALGMLLVSYTQMARAAETASLYDPLTGLPNRRLLLDRLSEGEHDALKYGHHLGIVYLDLDGFKAVNDTFGHGTGDDLLRSLSASLRRDLDPSHFLARAGGDEFVVLVTNPVDLDRIVAQLEATVAGERTPQGVSLSVSCGKAIFPGSSDTAREAMHAADADMYARKRDRCTALHSSAS